MYFYRSGDLGLGISWPQGTRFNERNWSTDICLRPTAFIGVRRCNSTESGATSASTINGRPWTHRIACRAAPSCFFALMFLLLFFLSCLSTLSLANTEIRNFHINDSEAHLGPSTLERLVSGNRNGIEELNATLNERKLSVVPARLWTPLKDVCKGKEPGECENEVWLQLALDKGGWNRYKKFTLRISWPAFVRSCLHLSLLPMNDSTSILVSHRLRSQPIRHGRILADEVRSCTTRRHGCPRPKPFCPPLRPTAMVSVLSTP